ncbi:MAG: hypothetical protein E6Q24_15530 [Chitinophagaceae bacterium]|jgi:DNA-directed RNA polymerase specialized sigma24 family protein|nr:MAG: hypothetical protein E6Q24_15530 [Chitinophagaceae bacterium]
MAWQDLQQEATGDLIEYMKWGNQPEYKDTADDAFIVFCFRYRDDVQKKCRIIARNWGYDTTVGDEIAEKTFARFRKYITFNPGECGKKDIDTCVKFYLYAIAGRILADHKKIDTEGPSPFTGQEQIIREFPDMEALKIQAERKAILKQQYDIIKNALDRLSPKHRIIYLTYKQYEAYLDEGYNLPRELLKALREELELSQASIRVYKKAAFDKVDEYLKIYGAK